MQGMLRFASFPHTSDIPASTCWRWIASRRSREGVKWYVVRAFGYRPRLPVPASFADLLLSFPGDAAFDRDRTPLQDVDL